MALDTPHIRLVPHSPAHLLALIESREEFEEQTGLRAANGLRDFMVSAEISAEWLDRLRGATVTDPWVHGFVVVHRETGLAIGTAGFKGPPDDAGAVEIAYGIVAEYERRGYATEAAAATRDAALSRWGYEHVISLIRPVNVRSQRVAERIGMTQGRLVQFHGFEHIVFEVRTMRSAGES